MSVRAKVLIVEDDPDVRRLYALGLNQRGYEVRLAANGAEAVERIAEQRPDIILLDWVLPLMNGGEVLDRLSGDSLDAPTPVIVISGQPCPPRSALDPRIEAWLEKPVAIDDLVGQIEQGAQKPVTIQLG